MNIARFAIRRPVTVAMAFVGLALLGVVSSLRMPIEQYPEVEIPFVGIGIPYANASPQELEREVARPVEEVLSTLGGIDRMFSISRPGFLFVMMNLNVGEDVTTKGIEAKEVIENIRHRLPDEIRYIQLRQADPNSQPILSMTISAPYLEPEVAYRVLDTRVRMALERVPGVNSVDLFGADDLYVRISLDPGRMEAHGRDILDVQRRLSAENFYLSAGSYDEANLTTQVRPLGRFRSFDDIRQLPMGDGLKLSDLATVDLVPKDRTERRRLNSEQALGISVHKRPEANLVAVAEAVQQTIAAAADDPLLADAKFVTLDNQATQVLTALEDLIASGILGGILSALVLLLFIQRLVPALLISATVPLSLIATLGGMYLLGFTLNIVSVVGLMLAIGLLVDNAVVVAEAVAQQRAGSDADAGSAEAGAATERGVTEVALAITAGTLTTVIVFLPTVFLDVPLVSTILENVAVPLCISLLASLIIAQTLIPTILARVSNERLQVQHPWFEKLSQRYAVLIAHTLRYRAVAGLAALLVAGSGYYAWQQLEVNMSPADDAQSLQLSFRIRGTIDFERMEGLVDQVEDVLIQNKEAWHLGDLATNFNTDRGRVFIGLRPGAPFASSVLEEKIRAALPPLPNVRFYFSGKSHGPGRRRGGGSNDGLGVRLIGDSTVELLAASEDLISLFEQLPMLTNVRTDAESRREELTVAVKPEQLARVGLNARNVARSVSVALGGAQMRRGYDEAGWENEVHLEISDKTEVKIDDLRRLPISLPDGGTVALETVADLGIRPTLRMVRRENRETSINVQFDLRGGGPAGALAAIENIMQQYQLPPGYRWEMGEDLSNEFGQARDLGLVLLVSIVLVYMLMAALFESVLFPATVLLAIVYSLVGVMLFLWLSNTPLTMMAMTGMVLLAGIVVNNGIVLMNRIFQLRAQGMARDAAIMQAGHDRLRPILMTVATTVVGMIPLAIGHVPVGGSGQSYLPMARAIIGGLTFSTIVTLLVLPLFYTCFDDVKMAAGRVWLSARQVGQASRN